MESRFKEWVYIEGLMQSAYHEAALKMNLSDSEFWMHQERYISEKVAAMWNYPTRSSAVAGNPTRP